MRRLAAILPLAILASCAGAASTPDPGPPLPVVVRYAPHQGQYIAVSKGRQEQEVPGGATTSEFGFRVHFATSVTGPANDLRVSFRVDSVSEAQGAGFPSTEVASAAGVTFTGRVAADGRITEFTGGDTTVALIQQLYETFEEFFPPIPPEGVSPGAAWSDTATSTTDRGGINVEIVSVASHEAVGWTTYGGVEALHLTSHAEYVLTGEGTQMGQSIRLDGTGVRDSHYYLGVGGGYLGAHAADSANMNALVVSMGLSIPIVQVRADSLLRRP